MSTCGTHSYNYSHTLHGDEQIFGSIEKKEGKFCAQLVPDIFSLRRHQTREIIWGFRALFYRDTHYENITSCSAVLMHRNISSSRTSFTTLRSFFFFFFFLNQTPDIITPSDTSRFFVRHQRREPYHFAAFRLCFTEKKPTGENHPLL